MKTEKQYVGFLIDRLGTLGPQKTIHYSTYSAAHDAVEKLMKKYASADNMRWTIDVETVTYFPDLNQWE